MRLWLRIRGREDFYYQDEDDNEICERCLQEEIKGKCFKSRYALRKSKDNTEYIFCFEKKVVAKQALHTANITLKSFNRLFKIANAKSKQVNKIQQIAYHNAKKMNAAIGQKIDVFLNGYEGYQNHSEIEKIKSAVINNPDLVSKNIFSVRKTVQQIESEYNLIEITDLSEAFNEKDLTKYKVHKLILKGSLFHEVELKNRNIFVDISPSDLSVKLDYGVANSIICQIFDNAQKYCKPSTTIKVEISEDNKFVIVKFEMQSLFFKNKDVENLLRFQERGSGTDQINGEGMGLYAINKFMNMHKGKFEMKSIESTKVQLGTKDYSTNLFVLSFPKY